MPYNSEEKRDSHGRWTKGDLKDAIKNKIKGKMRFFDSTGKVRGVTEVEHFNPQDRGLGLKEKLKTKYSKRQLDAEINKRSNIEIERIKNQDDNRYLFGINKKNEVICFHNHENDDFVKELMDDAKEQKSLFSYIKAVDLFGQKALMIN